MLMYHLDNSHIETPLVFGDIYVHQAGTLYCNRSTVINPHKHKVLFELTIVLDGEGEIITNGEPTKVKGRDIYLSFPDDTHAIRSDFRNPLKYDFLSFSTDNKKLKGEFDKIVQTNKEASERMFFDDKIRELTEDIISELNNPEQYFSEEAVYCALKLILIRTLRTLKNEKTPSAKLRISNPKAFCHTLRSYIDENIYNMKNLAELSDITGYNYSYLSAMYKKTTGETLAEYFSHRKTEVSKQLLREGLTVSKVAELLNYSSVYAFSKAFRLRCGISPKEYKKQGA